MVHIYLQLIFNLQNCTHKRISIINYKTILLNDKIYVFMLLLFMFLQSINKINFSFVAYY